MIHDFKDNLKFSHDQSSLPFWEEVYRAAFPQFESMVCVRKDGWAQRGGIDRVITLRSGKTYTVDEKVRRKDWPDILLERWSDEARQQPGWIQKDLACDFLAYAFLPSQTCYLFPVVPLQKAWRTHGREWIEIYEHKRSLNKGWTTVSIAVPKDILFEALNEAMRIKWQAAAMVTK